MDAGRMLGLAVTTLVDALAAAVVGGLLGWFVVPVLWVSDAVLVASLVAGVTGGATLAVGTGLTLRDPAPFPVTRRLLRYIRRIPVWI